MILSEKQKVNIVTRAIIISNGHLLITKWKDDFSFLIGGRVDFGESLEDSIVREVKEELGVDGYIKKLIYFNENIFHFKNFDVHEFGWYYLMEVNNLPIHIGEMMNNPDSSNLTIEFIPLDLLKEHMLYPNFLTEYLEQDYKNNFLEAPRHIYSNELNNSMKMKEMFKTCEAIKWNN